MKKVKIMLLSLALFAVVGGALAFKAKFQNQFCSVAAYWNGSASSPKYYCSFQPIAGGAFTTTSCGLTPTLQSTTDPLGVQKLCTTITDVTNLCTDGFNGAISCPVKTSIVHD